MHTKYVQTAQARRHTGQVVSIYLELARSAVSPLNDAFDKESTHPAIPKVSHEVCRELLQCVLAVVYNRWYQAVSPVGTATTRSDSCTRVSSRTLDGSAALAQPSAVGLPNQMSYEIPTMMDNTGIEKYAL